MTNTQRLRMKTLLGMVPRTSDNDDALETPAITANSSLDDIGHALANAQNYLVDRQGEVCRAMELVEELQKAFCEAVQMKNMGIVAERTGRPF